MGNYQNQDIENKGYRSQVTRHQVFNNISDWIFCDKNEKDKQEREKLRQAQQGNGKYIINGSDDRVNGKVYDGGNVDLYPTKDDERSYFYGYTIHGSRRLYAVVEALEKENKIEEIMAIGKRDFEHGIEEDRLGMLAQNEHYMEGYNAAQKAQKSR